MGIPTPSGRYLKKQALTRNRQFCADMIERIIVRLKSGPLNIQGRQEPEAVLHTVCAFANDFHNLGGGYILVGIAEDQGSPMLPPVGIDPNRLDTIQQELLNLGYHRIQPAYHPISAPYEIAGRQVLVIWCPGGQHRPYKAAESLAKDNRTLHYYIRKQSSTVRAWGEDERELISLTARIPFEATGMDFAQMCRQMNVVDSPAERLFPRNVGLMFFNEHPERFFPYTQIDVVHFPEGPGGSTFTNRYSAVRSTA